MATLNAGIAKIKKGSALDSLYNRLLAGLQTSLNNTLPDFTSGDYVIVKRNEQGVMTYTADEAKINASIEAYRDITTRNAAYLLASSFAGNNSTEDGGVSEGTPNVFVSITGDAMAGKLDSLYGFSAGDKGQSILNVYQRTSDNPSERKNIVQILGELQLGVDGLVMNGWKVLTHSETTLTIASPTIKLDGTVNVGGTLTLGELSITATGIYRNGKRFYHEGNSNKPDLDWSMANGWVWKNLTVKGGADIQSGLSALHGVTLGVSKTAVITISETGKADLSGDLNIVSGGIKINGTYVIHAKNSTNISFSAPGKILDLGDDNTKKITLQSDVFDDDGEYKLISKFGGAYFPESFRAGHGLGNVLFETYKQSTQDAGVIVNRNLRFGNAKGPCVYGDSDLLYMLNPFNYQGADGTRRTEVFKMSFGYILSTSLYAPKNRMSASMQIHTDADFIMFNKPIEGNVSIGIANSKTRLTQDQLLFSDSVYWQALQDGVKLYGNAYFADDIGSVSFTPGFAGVGWGVRKNKLSGNIGATFDEVTVRKKMRVYELEVQKQSVTNGSLWVSDACSGDIVMEI